MRIHNTLTRTREEFWPLTAGEVGMYVCGVTVYDRCHIGHARSAIVFDVVRRYLQHRGWRVRFVKNFTDVDDKIIDRAATEGVDAMTIAERYIAEYQADMGALGVGSADVEPRASRHIPQMLVLIEALIASGRAYVVEGDVYYAVDRFAGYGRLSGRRLEDLRAGARVDVDERKRNPLDFALWKAAKPGEPAWPSPWGAGRPGWHIECSAMAMEYLGSSFDIHGGGADLIFPHHENEIAQSEGVTGRPFARHWIHHAFVNFGAEKMSKSLGNTRTIRDLLARHDPEAIRLWLLGTHYRHPVDFAEDRLAESGRALGRLRVAAGVRAREVAELTAGGAVPPPARGIAEALGALGDAGFAARVRTAVDGFERAMDDDFNTPGALGALHELRQLSSSGGTGTEGDRFAASEVLAGLGRVLGLFERAPALPAATVSDHSRAVEALVAERAEARRARHWQRADELRAAIEALGAVVEDTSAGTRWHWGEGSR